MTINLIEKLSTKALDDSYFKDIYLKAEMLYTLTLFNKNAIEFSEKEFIDLLRFADILSNSENSKNRNYAYKIISLLYEKYKNNADYMFFSKAILIRIGNFPALQLIENIEKQNDELIEIHLPLDTIMLKKIKETVQAIPNSQNIFTDTQYTIFKSLEENNHFSFSGPTSLGKSFIIEAFINHIIETQSTRDRKNIVILVPTKALINQVSMKMSTLFNKYNYKILTYPTIPKLLKEKEYSFILVLTPERLVSYLSEVSNPKIDYLFVDEAQKIIADKDSLSPLYYHAIEQAQQKSVKLFFASPNIPNADIFLELFNKSTNESLNIHESTVAQNKYFIDLDSPRALYFSDFSETVTIKDIFTPQEKDLNYWLTSIGKNKKNLIYCNTINDTINYALELSRELPYIQDDEIENLINEIKQSIHPSYYLIDCLKKGVAYHFGQLPQDIRENIENIFQNNPKLNYLFCTSTLLEGVNLPAKNIFILSKNKGLAKLNKIDFWNLAGRAGRLTKELSGDIFCVRIPFKQNSWGTNTKDLEIVINTNIEEIKPQILNGKKNFYTNIENALLNKEFTNKSASFEEKKIWKHYSNIALIHHLKNSDSKLKSNLVLKSNNAKDILTKFEKNNNIPYDILVQSSSIKYIYQYTLWNNPNIKSLKMPRDVDYEFCLSILNILYEVYNWEEEESGGTNPLIITPNSLKHLAFLMSEWINGRPLNYMILNKINFHKKSGKIYINREYVDFDERNKLHINHLINTLVQDIENKLRFTLKNYFLNYYLICKESFPNNSQGENWADFLEYGTLDKKIIELQTLGLDRKSAKLLLDEYNHYFIFSENNITNINLEGLLKDLTEEKTTDINYKNMINFLTQLT